jgi:hypothetical protein
MSQPPKSTILALRARWAAFKAVFLSRAVTGVADVDMGRSSSGLTVLTIGMKYWRGQTDEGAIWVTIEAIL